MIPEQQQQQAAARLAHQQQQQQQILAAQQAQQASASSVQSHQMNQTSMPTSSTPSGTSAANRVPASSPSIATGNVKARVAGSLHEARVTPTIVTNLQPGQRLTTANFGQGSQNPTAIVQKQNIVGYVTPSGSKLNPAQMQQLINKNLMRQQQIKILQAQAASGQKVASTVAVSSGVGIQQRNATTLIKQAGTAAAVSQQVATAVKRQVYLVIMLKMLHINWKIIVYCT